MYAVVCGQKLRTKATFLRRIPEGLTLRQRVSENLKCAIYRAVPCLPLRQKIHCYFREVQQLSLPSGLHPHFLGIVCPRCRVRVNPPYHKKNSRLKPYSRGRCANTSLLFWLWWKSLCVWKRLLY